MRRRLLVRHFLSQFVENDWSPDIDRHQVLAVAAAALVTLPLFVTIFMSVKYLMQPLQSPGWTQTTAMGDAMIFCATSLLVSAIIATLEWEALALNQRDSLILGVLPVPRTEIVRAKVTALVTFAVAFVIALNALPAVLHPALMVANFQGNPLLIVLLVLAHALSTIMAGAFGFSCVVGLREFLFLSLGQRGFALFAGAIRSALLFSLLLLLVMVPIRLTARANSVLEPGNGPVLLQPVVWFAATHAAIAGRIVDTLREPSLPERLALEEHRLRRNYQRSLPHLTALAIRGTIILFIVMTLTLAMYLRNARRLQILPDGPGGSTMFGMSRAGDGLASALTARPARRAGMLFLIRTVLGSPPHRVYLIASMAAGAALTITMAPSAFQSTGDSPVRTSELAAQTLMLTAVVAGFRAAIRTSADPRAAWIFGVAEKENRGEFRKGVRLGVVTAIVSVVLLLLPFHQAAWGSSIALIHAMNGAALGWLLVEMACASVEHPLVWTIPPGDGLNTVGVVLLGTTVILVLVLARIERAALTTEIGSIAFAGTMLLLAAAVRVFNDPEESVV